MSRTVKENPAKEYRELYRKDRPEWHFDRSPRYGNQRKQRANLKVLARRNERRNSNRDTIYME